MSTAPAHLPTAAPPLPEVAAWLHEAFVDLAPGEPAHVVRVVGREPEELEIGLLALGAGEHPADHLLGVVAPPEWLAVGVVATGRSLPGPGRPGPGGPVRLTFVLPREGAATSLVSPVGSASHAGSSCDPPSGWLADICARVLGRPTVPPEEGPARWLESRWLDALVEAAAAHPRRRWSWPAVADLHPLADRGPAPAPAVLRARTERFSGEAGWGAIRRAVAGLDVGKVADRQGTGPVAGPLAAAEPAATLTPGLARWFDDGSFARYALQTALPVGVLADQLDGLFPPAVAAQARQALG